MSTTAAGPSEAASARDHSVDVLRCIGFVAIVVGHLLASNELVRELTYSWHVPLFFILAGLFWAPAGRSLAEEARHRSRTLLRPYLVWLVVVVAVLFLARGFSWDRLGDAALGGSYATVPLSAFWFVTALLVGALAYRALDPQHDRARVAIGAAALAVGTLVGHALSDIPEAAGTGLMCLFFMAVGDLLRVHAARLPAWTPLLLVPAGALVLGGIADPLDLKQGSFGTPVLSAVVAVAICVALLRVSQLVTPRLPGAVGAAATTIAGMALVLVLTHPLVLLTSWPGPVKLVVAFVVPIAIGFAVRRTRASGWLLGR